MAGNIKNSGFTGYYLEPSIELAKLWKDFFGSKRVSLEHQTQLESSFGQHEERYDFYLLDEEMFFDYYKGSPRLNGLGKPVFILSDYVDTNLLKNCLTTGIKNCFDRSTPLKEIYEKILTILKDQGSRDYTTDGKGNYWLTWREAKVEENVSHIADLSTLKKFKLMEEVFINEFFRAEGNLTSLAENLDKIARVTVKKYYNQFQRKIFSILIEHFPNEENVPFLRLDRSKFISAMKKQWFYDDFQSFVEMYDNDIEVLEKVLKSRPNRIKLFNLYWRDLLV